MRLLTLLVTALLVGCNGDADKDTSDTDADSGSGLDIDGDGYTAEDGDCDDGDAGVNPGVAEVWYDGVDQNCDQLDDFDQDQDGSAIDADCNDEDATISPDAAEVCDGVDNDCNGEVDEAGEFTAYLDADADGFGTGEPLGVFCELPEGTAGNDEDCDDTNAATSPLAEEVCDGVDNNCDTEIDVGVVDGILAYADADADGYGDVGTGTTVCAIEAGWVEDATDCDDTDVLTFPGATELCDLKDNNCDGSIDEGSPDARTYYADADADGYGDPAVTTDACGAPAGYVETGDDCNDADATLSPGADEICDGLDNNCDGGTDTDAVDGTTAYVDADGDAYGDDATMAVVCEVGSGYVTVGGDCDDADAATSPGASELCDGIDNNCDAATDESTATDAPSWYLDADLDGYGDPDASAPSCEQPLGFSGSGDDCNDGDAAIYPDAPELCDDVDNDCDGTVDDGADGLAAWYADADGDGYGDASDGIEDCEQPEGYVADDQDCDDADALSYPGAAEACDGEDQDCDGEIDEEATDGFAVYADADADGYGDPASETSACEVGPGWTLDASDCDDTAVEVNPAATETCNGFDDNCDGSIDPADAEGAATWYDDGDGDGFGSAGAATTACDAPVGTVSDATDCNDSAAGVYPGATETCDDVDQDCDGTVDDSAADRVRYYADGDADGYGAASSSTLACDAPSGYVTDATDCDDAEADANPGEVEACDEIDNDCDGSTDEAGAIGESTWYLDADADGYGLSSSSTDACWEPSGYTGTDGDCDDGRADSYPGAAEVADGLDNNCDGTVDEGLLAEGDVIVTEFARQTRFGGSSTNANGAWFELYNTTSADIDLSDWYITRYVASVGRDGFYVDPADGVVIPAGGYAVFCKYDDYTASVTSASDLICDYYWGDETVGSTSTGTYYDNTFNMQRDEDTISLYSGGDHLTGMLIDEVHWTYDATNGYWPRDASRSTQLDRTLLDHESNDDLDNWCSTTNNVFFEWYYVSASNREFGTPGIRNHTCP